MWEFFFLLSVPFQFVLYFFLRSFWCWSCLFVVFVLCMCLFRMNGHANPRPPVIVWCFELVVLSAMGFMIYLWHSAGACDLCELERKEVLRMTAKLLVLLQRGMLIGRVLTERGTFSWSVWLNILEGNMMGVSANLLTWRQLTGWPKVVVIWVDMITRLVGWGLFVFYLLCLHQAKCYLFVLVLCCNLFFVLSVGHWVSAWGWCSIMEAEYICVSGLFRFELNTRFNLSIYEVKNSLCCLFCLLKSREPRPAPWFVRSPHHWLLCGSWQWRAWRARVGGGGGETWIVATLSLVFVRIARLVC